MENKVKFHALERLDLVDVNALQDNMYTYMAKAFGNLIGNASGLLQLPNTITIDTSNELIVFSDFIYIEAQDDTDYANSFENRVIAHDTDLANGVCDYDSALQAVQTYYTDNSNTLPDGPRASGYNSNNSNLFPYIWVRKRILETTQDNRRFWNTSNDTETTTPVVTRVKYAVDFTLNHLTPAGGYTRIGRIIDWDVTGNTVELPTATQSIELYTFTDDVYFTDGDFTLDSSSEFASLLSDTGFRQVFQTIRKHIFDIRGNGSLDSNVPNMGANTKLKTRPLYSMDGLYYSLLDVRNRVIGRKRGQSVFTITVSAIDDAHTLTVNSYVNSTRDYVIQPSIHFDYTMLQSKSAPPTFPLDFSLTSEFGTNSTSARNWIAGSSLFAIEVGDTYLNHGLIANSSIVACLIDDYNSNRSPNILLNLADAVNNFEEKFFQLGTYVVTDSQTTGSFDDILKVKTRNYVDSDGDDNSFKGFKVGLHGLDSVITTTNLTNYTLKISVKVDFELIEP